MLLGVSYAAERSKNSLCSDCEDFLPLYYWKCNISGLFESFEENILVVL